MIRFTPKLTRIRKIPQARASLSGHVTFFAHRGASHLALENTLPAIQRANDIFMEASSRLGTSIRHGHEFDVLETKALPGERTRTRLYIMIQNWVEPIPMPQSYQRFEREHGRKPKIAELTPAEVRSFYPTDPDAKPSGPIPFLKEVLDTAAPTDFLYIEAKRDLPESAVSQKSDGFEINLIDFLEANEGRNRGGIFSFDAGFLMRARAYLTQKGLGDYYPLGLISKARDYQQGRYYYDAIRPQFIAVEFGQGLEEVVRVEQAEGRQVFTWTVNKMDDLYTALRAGVNGHC